MSYIYYTYVLSIMRVYFTSPQSTFKVIFTNVNGSIICSQNKGEVGQCFGARFRNENMFRYLEHEELPILEYNVYIGNSSKPFLFRYPPTPPPEPPPPSVQSHFLEWGFGALFLVLVGMYALMRSCSNGRAKRVFKTTASKTLGETRQPRFT